MPFDNAPSEIAFVTKLRKARELITDPRKHTTGALFKDERGRILDVTMVDGEYVVPDGSYSMCLEGAMVAAGLSTMQRAGIGRQFVLLHGESHPTLNDRASHSTVLRVMDKVIDKIAAQSR